MTRAKRWTIAATVLGSGMVFLDSTIVPVALPKIGEELSRARWRADPEPGKSASS